MKRSDADLVQEALGLVTDRPEEDRLRQIVTELHKRTTNAHGQQKYIAIWTMGRKARTEGIPLEDCPYRERQAGKRTFTTAFRNWWIKGWKGVDKGMERNRFLRDLSRASVEEIISRRRRRPA